MQVYLAVTPQEVNAASAYCHSFAHVAYRIGPESSLLRQSLLIQTQGGLLSLSDRDAPHIKEPDKLCGDLLRECTRRGYNGVLADFEEPPTGDRSVFIEKLSRLLHHNHRVLYVPESYSGSTAMASVLLCTAMSGGNYTSRLHEAAAQKGASRLALDVQRLCMDFSLPNGSGEGKPLSLEALTRLRQEQGPEIFFSQDLCTRYFTYTKNRETHFVLYDDADTLLQKIRIGSSLGFSAAFFMYPEVSDLMPKLFPSLTKKR